MLKILALLLLTLTSITTVYSVKFHRPWQIKRKFLYDWSHTPHTLYYFAANYTPRIPYTTAREWVQIYQTFGTIQPMKLVIGYETRGRNRVVTVEDLVILVHIIANHPTYYNFEIQQEFYYITNKILSISTIFQTLFRLNITRKKISQLSRIQHKQKIYGISYIFDGV